jgi:WD40 repeat protein
LLAAALTLFLVVATFLTLFAFSQQSEAASQRLAAQNNAATAVANGAVADSARATAQANLTHSEALRLAAEASRVMQTGGSSELAGLLSLRSIQLEYTTEGDAVLEEAAQLDYPVRRFVGHAEDEYSGVFPITFSPDGKTLYTQSSSSTRLWDVATGRQIANIDFGGDVVSWAPDSKHILATHDDGTLYIWDTVAMTYTQSPITHTAALWWAAYSPDGHSILTSSSSITDTTAQVWDAATGRQLQVFHGSAPFTEGLAWSPDGRYVVTGDRDNLARLWDVQTGQQVRTFQTGLVPGAASGVQFLSYSPDGKTIAGESVAGTRLWDAATGAVLREFEGSIYYEYVGAFSRDGKTLLTQTNSDSTVRLWDVATGQQLRALHGSNAGLTTAVISPDGRQAAAGYIDGTLLLWDLGGPAYPPMQTEGTVRTAEFSTDDRLVLTGGGRQAGLFEAATGRQLSVFPGPQGSSVNSATFSPDGKFLLIGNGGPGNAAHILDIQTGADVQTFPVGDVVISVSYSRDGKTVLTSDNSGALRLWDAASAQPLRVIPGLPSEVVTFAPDEKSIATANDPPDNSASLWDIASGQQLRHFTGHTDLVYGVAFSPDGKWLATGSRDTTVRLWDVAGGQELRRFAGHTDRVYEVAFSPDGKWLATSSSDKTARLWDVATGQELRRFSGHADGMRAVAFSHDGKLLLTGSEDGTARIWRTDYHDTMRYLCGALIRDLTPEERTQYGITDPGPTCTGP